MIAAIVAAIIDLNPTSSAPPAAQSAAESFASAATAAFAGTELSSNPNLTAAQRSAGIPTDPVASWDIPTSGGRHVQLVLPGGLGAGQVTPGGQVVYPDRGAGFDVMAENTGTSRRTITRIPSAPAPSVSGIQPLPVVTMFVRTPVDTVMFARTDGVLTVNEATPEKKPIAAIAPAAARDAHGAVVPSGFVTTKIKPGLYLLSQVIKLAPDTAFPVYADPAWLDSVVDTVVSASNTAVNFVKANPVESIEIVAGGVMVATGVGTGFGVGLIADGATSLVQKAGEATGNTGLQAFGGGMEVLGYLSPTHALRKGLTNIAEREVEQLGKKELDDVATGALGHADDVTVIKPVTPSAPPKLPDPAAAKPADLPTTPGVDTPKIPTGPPSSGTVEPGTAFPQPVKTEIHLDARDDVGNMHCEYCGERIYAQEGPTLKGDKIPATRAQIDHYKPRKLGGQGVRENGRAACQPCNSQKGEMDTDEFEASRDDIVAESRRRIRAYETTHGTQPDGVWKTPNDRPGSPNLTGQQQLSESTQRPSSPNDQRTFQAFQVREVTDEQRDDARDSAQRNGQSGNSQRSHKDSGPRAGRTAHEQKKSKKQSTKHKQRKGQR